MAPRIFQALSCLITLTLCQGAIYENAADLPKQNYDFVIVGGGPGGSTVANRLTENPHISVLVLEAGVSNKGLIDSIVPFFFLSFGPNVATDWNFTTVPQRGLGGRSIPYIRGHVLGGCTTINAMVYTRGSAEDFDRYANVTGDPGWSWDRLQPYFHKNEKWTPPADHHNTAGQFDPAVHGFKGINSVSLAAFPRAYDGRIIQATRELGDEFHFNLDMNSGRPLGLGWLQSTIKGGRRSSSATSYLGPEFITRPNLHVLLHARVTRLLQTSSGKGRLSFNAVEFAQSEGAPKHRVTASNEVVLSAGTIGTPHILMHSGIGDEQALRAVGVKPILHLPDVGKNVSDQPLLSSSWFVNSTDTLDTVNRNAILFAEIFRRWNRTETGLFADGPASHLAFLRLPNNASVFEKFPDPSAGPHTPHLELFTVNGAGSDTSTAPPDSNFISIGAMAVSILGRGSITLNSSNPFIQPLIDPGFLNTDFDMFAMRAAVRSSQQFFTAPAWKDYILEPFGDLANATTDTQLDEYIRNNAGSSWHIVGSAAMSAKDANYGVVNPDLRVKGVTGLRVVDASIFPFVPSGHTQVPTYVIAERASDLIKAAWDLE